MELRDYQNNLALRIDGDKCYDTSGRWVYEKNGNYILNATGNWVLEIRGDRVYDTRGDWVYRIVPKQLPDIPANAARLPDDDTPVLVKDTAICPHCGHELKPAQKFCVKCGALAAAGASAPPVARVNPSYAQAGHGYAQTRHGYTQAVPAYAQPPKKSRVPLMVASIIVVVALGVGAAFFFTNRGTNAGAANNFAGSGHVPPGEGGTTDGSVGVSRLWDLVVGEWVVGELEAYEEQRDFMIIVKNRNGTGSQREYSGGNLTHVWYFTFDILYDYTMVIFHPESDTDAYEWTGHSVTNRGQWYVTETHLYNDGDVWRRR